MSVVCDATHVCVCVCVQVLGTVKDAALVLISVVLLHEQASGHGASLQHSSLRSHYTPRMQLPARHTHTHTHRDKQWDGILNTLHSYPLHMY